MEFQQSLSFPRFCSFLFNRQPPGTAAVNFRLPTESKSKRVSLKKRYKIIRKVEEHHRKEAKRLGLNKKKKVEKDPGNPNEWPFKEQELASVPLRNWSSRKLPVKKGEHKYKCFCSSD